MSKRDYYDVLGVSKDATKQEIRKAYRSLSKKYHPDLNKEAGAEEQFKEITEAFEVLSDDDKRAQYDQYGHDGPQGFGGFGGGNAGGFGGGFGFEDIFSTFFGGGGGGRQRDPNAPRQGADLQYTMTLDFLEAVFGKTTEITIPREEECTTCHGSGAKPGTDVKTCTTCGGSGEQTVAQNTPLGQMMTKRTCSTCGGSGKIIPEKCTTCHGSGRTTKERKIEIKIPAGIDDNQRLRVPGQGEAGINGGPPGDLYIVFHVKAHDKFARDGDDIYFNLKISFPQAALGDVIKVPTVDGFVELKIPAGTQSGKKFRMLGKGVKNVNGHGYGNHYVIVDVVTPTKMTEKQKELLREFASIDDQSPNEYSSSFFDKLKRTFKGE